jgi:hypothetical protein
MPTPIQNNKKIIEMASDLRGFIQDHKWVTRYDSESDAFSVTQSKLSKDARIRYLDDEIAFYIAQDNKIEGIFVEYFRSNFVKHHKDLKSVLKGIEGKDNKKRGLVELGKAKISKIAPDLEEALKSILAEKLNVQLDQAI